MWHEKHQWMARLPADTEPSRTCDCCGEATISRKLQGYVARETKGGESHLSADKKTNKPRWSRNLKFSQELSEMQYEAWKTVVSGWVTHQPACISPAVPVSVRPQQESVWRFSLGGRQAPRCCHILSLSVRVKQRGHSIKRTCHLHFLLLT